MVGTRAANHPFVVGDDSADAGAFVGCDAHADGAAGDKDSGVSLVAGDCPGDAACLFRIIEAAGEGDVFVGGSWLVVGGGEEDGGAARRFEDAQNMACNLFAAFVSAESECFVGGHGVPSSARRILSRSLIWRAVSL